MSAEICGVYAAKAAQRHGAAQRFYSMKIIKTEGRSQPDPYIIFDNGKYYVYCTAYDGVDSYVSDKLDGFEYLGKVLTQEGQKEYWAPCVIKLRSRYYMYYSSMPQSSDDVHLQAIKVAVADSPAGPFVYVKDVLPPFSIDADVHVNESGLYMFYSVNDLNSDRVGTYIRVDRMTDPFTLAGESIAAVRPTRDEEIFQRDRFQKGQHWHTIEGASYFYQNGWHYCLFSGNCYEKDTYHVGYAAVKSQDMRLNKLHFQKYPDDNTYAPLLASNDYEYGTGHNSVIKVDGQWYVVYHGRDSKIPSPQENRPARICKLFAKDGVLTVERQK